MAILKVQFPSSFLARRVLAEGLVPRFLTFPSHVLLKQWLGCFPPFRLLHDGAETAQPRLPTAAFGDVLQFGRAPAPGTGQTKRLAMIVNQNKMILREGSVRPCGHEPSETASVAFCRSF
jgi:hypothetical protein